MKLCNEAYALNIKTPQDTSNCSREIQQSSPGHPEFASLQSHQMQDKNKPNCTHQLFFCVPSESESDSELLSEKGLKNGRFKGDCYFSGRSATLRDERATRPTIELDTTNAEDFNKNTEKAWGIIESLCSQAYL